MKPEQFSPLGMYGDKDVFERRLKQGYTEVAFGGGDWVGDERIVSIWVFYHPHGRIATYEHPKFDNGGYTVRGDPYTRNYSQESFQKHQEKFQIKLSKKTSLAEIVQNWEK